MNIGEATNQLCSTECPEKPLIVLKFKPWISYFCMIAVLMCSVLFSFGTIVPYMATFDFNQIWPANSGGVGKKIILFILSWIFWLYSPTLISVFIGGNVYIYEKFIELRPFLPFIKKRIVYFDELRIRIRKGRGMLLTNLVIPIWWKSPYLYWKIVSLYGFGIPFSTAGLKNPESLSLAIELVKARAISISNF